MEEDGRVVILDFGIAVRTDPAGLARVRCPRGTRGYMAPEQGRGGLLTDSADLFALGRLLRRCLGSEVEIERHALGDLEGLAARLTVDDPAQRPSMVEVLAHFGVPATPRVRRGQIWVGRAAELERLERWAYATSEVRNALVLVHGPAGAGKSALVERLASRLSRFWVLRGRCNAQELLSYRGVESALHAAGVSPPALPSTMAPTRAEDAVGASREARLAETAAQLGSVAGGRSILMLLDDVQWGDADGGRLVRYLLDLVPRLCVVVTSRAERDGRFLEALGWAEPEPREWDTRRLPLGPLPVAEADDLAARVGAELRGVEAFPSAILRLAEGGAQGAEVALSQPAIEVLRLLGAAAVPLEIDVVESVLDAGALDQVVFALRNRGLVDVVDSAHRAVLVVDPEQVAAMVGVSPDAPRLHRRIADELRRRGEVADARLAYHLHAARSFHEAETVAARAAEQAESALAFGQAATLWGLVQSCRVEIAGAVDPDVQRRLAEVLVADGRGVEAARLLLSLSSGDPTPETRRRAGECLLTAGRVSEGLDVLRPLLAWRAEHAAWGTTQVRIVAHLVALGFGLRRFAPRTEVASPNTWTADLWWSVGKGLVNILPDHGVDAILRSARAAAGTGDSPRLARALAFVGSGLQTFPWPLSVLGRQWLGLAERMAEDAGDDALRAVTRLWGSLDRVFTGRWNEAATMAEGSLAAIELAPGMAWERTAARTFELLSREQIGDYRAMVPRIRLALRDAEGRGDLYAQVVFRQFGAIASLLGDDPVEAARAADWVEEVWRAPRYAVQDLYNLRIRVLVALYEGQPGRAAELMKAERSRVVGSGLLDTPMSRIDYFLLEARVGLAGSPGERSASASPSTWARRLARERRPDGGAWAGLIRAALHARAGRSDAASRDLADAAVRFDSLGMRGAAAVARARRVELVGDDAAFAGVCSSLRGLGVDEPIAWLRVVTPGFGPPGSAGGAP